MLCTGGGSEGSSGGSSGEGGPPTNLNNNLMLGLTLMGALLLYQVSIRPQLAQQAQSLVQLLCLF